VKVWEMPRGWGTPGHTMWVLPRGFGVEGHPVCVLPNGLGGPVAQKSKGRLGPDGFGHGFRALRVGG
jgi:hypothetical protein